MKITLDFITGKDTEGEEIVIQKTFIAKVKARSVRDAMSLITEVNFDNLTPSDLDKVVSFVTDIYGNKFTIDELYDGLEANLFMPTLIESVEGIINGVSSRLDTFPKE
ncbi:phage tail assembly chaperone G [Clostridium tagluense]|uniref:phage tail assembly chaperone G n=1 Tax=Clostridium tagluense TaxID=360422 RepID=UPI001CF49C3E|nr:hypothetical protein [Clostridium tagluense]MCB2300656.1 hypothetical protein [Clostridium tagluense]